MQRPLARFFVFALACALCAPAAPAQAQTAITSFSPTSGGTGVNVTITGTNLTGTSVVKFNGTNAKYAVVSATSITAVVPVGASTGPISLVAPGGTATSATNFTYYAAPTITGFTPTSGAVGTSVAITGTNFQGTTVVGFNGHHPTSFTVSPDGTTITTTVPSGATTGTIGVITPGGETFSTASFTVIGPPTITGFTPTSGAVGTSVAITGTNFQGTTVVGFNGHHPTSFTVSPDGTTITTTVPSGATTGTIGVITPGGETFSATNFTVVAPSSATLANLSVSPSSVIGGTSATATVALTAPAPSGGVTVALLSGSSTAVVPSSLTVPSGNSSATFTIKTSSVSATTPIAISGRYQGLTQAATLYVQPAGTSLAVTNLTATAGNACAVMSWAELPEGAVTGYNVYRLSGGKPVKLTQTPQATSIYADTGLTNGTAYQYEVSSVDTTGRESSLSSPVSVTPSATKSTLSWVSFPSSASGHLTLYASPSDATTGFVMLVDGNEYGSAGSDNPSGSNSGPVQADLDVTGLSNGTHVLQLIGYTAKGAVATVPASISCSDVVSAFLVDETADITQGQLVNVSAVLPSNTATATTTWSVQIASDLDGSTVYTLNGAAPTVHFAWNTKSASGAQLPSGNYTVTLTATTVTTGASNVATTSTSTQTAPVTLISGSPKALALLTRDSFNPDDDSALAFYIEQQFATIKQSYPDFAYCVIALDNGVRASPGRRSQVLQWMATTVTDFYLFGHGEAGENDLVPPSVGWGGGRFYAGATFTGGFANLPPEDIFAVPTIVGSRQYNFVWIDACASAGFTPNSLPANSPTDIGVVDPSWANAFNIGTNIDFSSAFLGWDGYAGTNTNSVANAPSNWLNWRQLFWGRMGSGYYTSQAVDWANMYYIGTGLPLEVSPTDMNAVGVTRWQLFGDTTLP